MTAVIMSSVGSELSPGVTPLAAAPDVETSNVPILSTVPATAKTGTAVIPASMPARVSVGRTTGGVPTTGELPNEVSVTEFAMTSATPVTLTIYTGTPTEVGVGAVDVVLLLTTPQRGYSVQLLGLPPLRVTVTAVRRVAGTAIVNVL